jgi:UDP-glucose 4-epimerase
VRVLVTGSSGRLGSAVAAVLAPCHEVVGLDRVPGAATHHVGGVEDRELLAGAMRGVEAVVHTASFHAPHVGAVARRNFLAVNVEATRRLLELAAAGGVRRVVYTSTTSVYGQALVPTDRAVWVTEALAPRPRDVYDETKLAAERLCAQFAADTGLPTICLRTARFFPEAPALVAAYRLCRGVDVRDAAVAHLLAVEETTIPFGVFNVSARSPFAESDLAELLVDAPRVIGRYHPWAEAAFAARGWALPASIDRVYVVAAAERALGYRPVHDFASLFPESAAIAEH